MISIEDIFKNVPITNEIIVIFVSALILSLVFKKFRTKRMSQKDKNKKGAEYEKYVSSHYKNKGYTIEERGGFQDGGIDLIGYKDNKILLIQCKNWNPDNSFKISEINVKEFYGACNFYMDNNDMKNKEILCIYVIPNKKLLNSNAISLFKKNYKNCRYEIIDFKK